MYPRGRPGDRLREPSRSKVIRSSLTSVFSYASFEGTNRGSPTLLRGPTPCVRGAGGSGRCFGKSWRRFRFPSRWVYVMGGLARDSDDPMPEETRAYVQMNWREVTKTTGAEFNWDFWRKCKPRRSTYPACRAVLAAGAQREDAVPEMFDAIQRAYYREARNPSDIDTLTAVAGVAFTAAGRATVRPGHPVAGDRGGIAGGLQLAAVDGRAGVSQRGRETGRHADRRRPRMGGRRDGAGEIRGSDKRLEGRRKKEEGKTETGETQDGRR